MAVNIGPKIGIDGEAQFRKELNNLIQQSKTLESEMKAVTSSFDQNADSQEKLEAQAKILNQQIEVQDKRVEMLEKGLQDAAKEYGDTATQTLKWEQALNEAKTAANNMKSQLSKMEDGVEDVTEELEDAEEAAFDFGDAFAANLLAGSIIEGVKSLAGEIGNLTEETKEYRKIMASLEVSSEKAGYTAEQTTEIYKTLYGVLGDEQTAATTTANLQAIGLEQEKLTEITNAAIGAWASYGDSIPIDGLAESVNETIKSGQVTGTLADVLNWAAEEGETFGVKLKANTKANEEWNKAVKEAATAEDYFNLALQDAAGSTERANIVLKLFSKQGLAKAGEAWQENNKDIVEANKATADFQEITSKMAKKFSPISITMQKGFNKILDSASNLVDESDIEEFTGLLEDGADLIADDVLPVIKDLFDFVIDNKDYVVSGLAGIGSAVASWKIMDVIIETSDSFDKLTSGIEDASGAVKLFNGMWNANPLGIAATLIGGTVTAVDLLTTATNNETEALKESRKEIEKNQEAIEDSLQAYTDAKEARSEAAEADLVQIENAQALAEELQTLADKNGKVTDANKTRAQFILNELNNALGTEYTMTGNQINKYKDLEEQVYKTIEAKKIEILMNQALGDYEEALKNKGKAEENFYREHKLLVEKQQQVDEAYSEVQQRLLQLGEDSLESYYINHTKNQDTALRNYVNNWESEKQLLAEQQANYDSAKLYLYGYYQDIAFYTDANELQLEGNTQKLLAMLERQNDGFKTATNVASLSAEEQKQALDNQYQQALFIFENYRKEYKKGTEGFNKETLEILENAAENARIEAEKVGINIVDGTKSSLKSQMDASFGLFSNIGKQIISGVSSGVNSGKSSLNKAINNAMSGAIAAAEFALDIHSPSKEFEKIGKLTMEGFGLGFDEEMDAAYRDIVRQFENTCAALGEATLSIPARAGGSNVYNDNARIEIVVNAAPGQSEDAIADAVMYKIQNAVQRKGAVYK